MEDACTSEVFGRIGLLARGGIGLEPRRLFRLSCPLRDSSCRSSVHVLWAVQAISYLESMEIARLR